MRLDINLATRPYEDAGRFWLRWGSAMALLGLVTLALLYTAVTGWMTARKDRNLIAQTRTQIAACDQEMSAAEALLNQAKNTTTRDRSQFLNDLFRRKAFSWTHVFADMEQVMPPGLHVVSIHPEMNPDNQLEIKLVVAGESHDRALELVRKMESSQRFQQTRIEQETQATQAGADNVTFNITALYAPEVETTVARSGQ